MPGKVTLLVTAGPIQGRRFEFTEHDTLRRYPTASELRDALREAVA